MHQPIMLSSLRRFMKEMMASRDLILTLAERDITVTYTRSLLGMLWALLNPLLTTAVFAVIFSVLFQDRLGNFLVYFLSAFLVWQFFANTATAALTLLTRYASIYKKVHVRKNVFVLSMMLANLVHFGFALIALAVIMVVTGQTLSASLLFLPVAVLLMIAFAMGFAFLLAPLGLFFDDVHHIMQVLLTLWMYLSAIFYPLDIVPEQYRPLIYANPMFHIIECFRMPWYAGTLPTAENVAIAALSSMAVLVVGWAMFHRLEDRFVFYV